MKNKASHPRLSTEADQALDRMLARANDGFAGGKITKPQLVAWLIVHLEQHCFEECIPTIQKQHFDQMAYLGSALKEMKKARKEGLPIPDIKSMLEKLTS